MYMYFICSLLCTVIKQPAIFQLNSISLMQIIFETSKNCGSKRNCIKKNSNSLFKFREDLGNVSLRCKTYHNVQFLKLHIYGIIVLDKEHLHLMLEDVGPLLNNEVDVAKRHILHLHTSCKNQIPYTQLAP